MPDTVDRIPEARKITWCESARCSREPARTSIAAAPAGSRESRDLGLRPVQDPYAGKLSKSRAQRLGASRLRTGASDAHVSWTCVEDLLQVRVDARGPAEEAVGAQPLAVVLEQPKRERQPVGVLDLVAHAG